MIFPESDSLREYPRYILALLAAKRAQELKAEDNTANIGLTTRNYLTEALDEIAAGKIKPRILSPDEVEVEFADQVSDSTLEQVMGSEPKPQEAEVVAPPVPGIAAAEAIVEPFAIVDEPAEPSAPPMTLGDLAGDEAQEPLKEEEFGGNLDDLLPSESADAS
ncbi:MAG: DNA-directed RNA polymerase subunit omega [Armatimonadetes bacterium]|nr:DNA-directed RNA polymerase subunit omega [Armatimonadota bacterium]